MATHVFGQYAASSWPTFHQNNNHLGVAVGGGSNGILKWKFSSKLDAQATSSPVTGADGTIYLGDDGGLLALNPNGTVKWNLDSGAIDGAAAVATNGTIYIATGVAKKLDDDTDAGISAVNPNGTLKWFYKTWGGQYDSPSIGVDGTVYCGDQDGYMYALTPSGSLKWSFLSGGPHPAIMGAPAIGLDGKIYFGNTSGYFYCLSPQGVPLWTFTTGSYGISNNQVMTSPTIGPDGTIYVNTDYYFYALNSTGHVKWSYSLGSDYFPLIQCSPVIAPDGTIYIGNFTKQPNEWVPSQLMAFTPAGQKKWTYWASNGITSSPAIGGDGTIYFGSYDDNVYALNPNGTLQWTYLTGGIVESSPAIASDGTVYVGSADSYLYAIGTQVATVPVASITLNPPSVAGGLSTTATVKLASAAPSVGNVVSLSCASTSVLMQTALFFPSGTTTETFKISTYGVASNINVPITATSGSKTVSTTLNIRPSILVGVTAPSVNGGIAGVGTVKLNGFAPPDGAVVTLTSSNGTDASVPTTVTVPYNSQTVQFPIKTVPVSGTVNSTITATYAGVSESVVFSVFGDSVSTVSLSPASIQGGHSSTVTVTLTAPAPTGGWLVSLSCGASYVTVPNTVTVAAGSKTATFTANAKSNSQSYTAYITAKDALSSKGALLTVTDDSISSLKLSTATVTEGQTVTGTVTLKTAAPAGGWVISFTTSNGNVASVPISVTIPAGSSSATFQIKTGTVAKATAVTIGATDATSSSTTTLTVNASSHTAR